MYYLKKTPVAIKKLPKNKKTTRNEIKALNICTNLVVNKQSVNLPILYGSCSENKHSHLLLEHYDMTMSEWCQTKHSVKEWEDAYFQIMSALLSLEKNDIFLYDIKFDNIMVKKIRPRDIIYIIDKKIYQINNCQYIFILIDFGFVNLMSLQDAHAYSLSSISNNSIKRMNIERRYKGTSKMNFFKKHYPKLYDSTRNELIERYKRKEIIYSFNGKKQPLDETVDFYLDDEIDQYLSTNNQMYKKFVKKEKYLQQPNKIIKTFSNLYDINFEIMIPKIFDKNIVDQYDNKNLDIYVL